MYKRLYWLLVFVMPLMGGSHARYYKPSKHLAALNAQLVRAGVKPVLGSDLCRQVLD